MLYINIFKTFLYYLSESISSLYCLLFPFDVLRREGSEKEILERNGLINLFLTNAPLILKPGSWFLLAKYLKNT